MSNIYNDELMERAKDMLEYWDSTTTAKIIQRDIATDDLEALSYHVMQAEAEAAREELHNHDVVV